MSDKVKHRIMMAEGTYRYCYDHDKLLADCESADKDARISELENLVGEFIVVVGDAVGYIKRHPENALLPIGSIETMIEKSRSVVSFREVLK